MLAQNHLTCTSTDEKIKVTWYLKKKYCSFIKKNFISPTEKWMEPEDRLIEISQIEKDKYPGFSLTHAN